MSIGKKFIENTKYQNLEEPAQKKGVPQPALENPVPKDAKLIALPDPHIDGLESLDFYRLLADRGSLRNYTEQTVSIEEFSFLLWATQGVREVTDRPVTKRIVPSAGSRHAFETYILVNKVKRLQTGLYRYAALQHKVYQLPASENITEELTAACLSQKHVFNSALTFFWIAVPFRMAWRYSDRAYRYLHLDAGHVCQNLYLAAEAIHCGVCAIAAFDDDAVNEVLGLDGEEQFAIYIASLGKRE